MSTPASTTAPVKITVEPPRAARKARAPRTAKPPQAPAPPAKPAAKPKPERLGTGILPAKRKAVPGSEDITAPWAVVVKCVEAPPLPPKHTETPDQYIASHLYRIVESAAPVKEMRPGTTFHLHHAKNGAPLGQYVVIKKSDWPAAKLIIWVAQA